MDVKVFVLRQGQIMTTLKTLNLRRFELVHGAQDECCE